MASENGLRLKHEVERALEHNPQVRTDEINMQVIEDQVKAAMAAARQVPGFRVAAQRNAIECMKDRTMKHTHSEVIQKFYQAYSENDQEGMRAILANDVRWTFPGHHHRVRS
jgi:hypothetical protein